MIARQLLKKGSEHYTNTTGNEHFEDTVHQADANQAWQSLCILPLKIQIKLVSRHAASSAAYGDLLLQMLCLEMCAPKVKSAFRLLCPLFCTRSFQIIPGHFFHFHSYNFSHQLSHSYSAGRRGTQRERSTQRSWSRPLSSLLPPLFLFPSPPLTPFTSLFLFPNPSWLALKLP